MASRYRRMRGSISYKQPSTKRGEAQMRDVAAKAAELIIKEDATN